MGLIRIHAAGIDFAPTLTYICEPAVIECHALTGSAQLHDVHSCGDTAQPERQGSSSGRSGRTHGQAVRSHGCHSTRAPARCIPRGFPTSKDLSTTAQAVLAASVSRSVPRPGVSGDGGALVLRDDPPGVNDCTVAVSAPPSLFATRDLPPGMNPRMLRLKTCSASAPCTSHDLVPRVTSAVRVCSRLSLSSSPDVDPEVSWSMGKSQRRPRIAIPCSACIFSGGTTSRLTSTPALEEDAEGREEDGEEV